MLSNASNVHFICHIKSQSSDRKKKRKKHLAPPCSRIIHMKDERIITKHWIQKMNERMILILWIHNIRHAQIANNYIVIIWRDWRYHFLLFFTSFSRNEERTKYGKFLCFHHHHHLHHQWEKEMYTECLWLRSQMPKWKYLYTDPYIGIR